MHAPTYDNLIRWTESPGKYDLQGVDISAKAKESVKAGKVEGQFVGGDWVVGVHLRP
ncbi:MAG: hypothetical protein H6558_22630 [Lewinellaceae bacterium]|nr:hypothetical protein [Lewinellaceae bacterium]